MNKRMTFETKVLCALGVMYVVRCSSMVKVIVVESKKRKKIQEWELMNLSAIKASKARLTRMADDPDVHAPELIKAVREEREFLKIIQNQPMY